LRWAEVSSLAAHLPSAGRAPHSRGQRYAAATTGDWVGGVLLPLLMALVGLIVGAVYAAKGGEKRASA
jgi:hypothetical protein